VVLPPVTTPLLVVEFGKTDIKAKRTIIDAVKDHIIPHVFGKVFSYEMWTSLCKRYWISNQNRLMVLQEKLRSI
jgi:hypothetical protein